MIVTVRDPKTSRDMEIDTDSIDLDKLKSINTPLLSRSKLMQYIDDLNISADAKTILATISEITIKIGGIIYTVGRKVLELSCYFIKTYSSTGVGFLVGATVGILISSIPLIGYVLGPIALPLFAALGLAYGFLNDMQDLALEQKIKSTVEEFFGALKSVPVVAS